VSTKPQVSGRAAGESACRPGSVTPGFLTCCYSPAWPSDLRRHYVRLRDTAARFES
jgi:hypothetical protein